MCDGTAERNPFKNDPRYMFQEGVQCRVWRAALQSDYEGSNSGSTLQLCALEQVVSLSELLFLIHKVK
jgi:hypothetical protein